MALDFEKYAARGNEFVNLVRQDLGISRDKASRIIQAVLHALRNRLTHEESFQLMAQLPLALKGIYVDGWKFGREFTRIHSLEDFLEEIRNEDGGLAGFDFGNNAKAELAAGSVFRALKNFISEGEMKDVVDVLPTELKEFIARFIAEKTIVQSLER